MAEFYAQPLSEATEKVAAEEMVWYKHAMKVVLLGMVPLFVCCAWSEPPDFNRDIRPILSGNCFECHGPDENERKAKLRLDVSEGADGAYRARDGVTAIAPGSLEKSEVWRRITSTDPDEIMPTPKSHKKPLDPAQRDLIKAWIENGAEYEGFWAWQAPQKKAASIDEAVAREHARDGLSFAPEAERRTLVRRLHLDLTGLPPSRETLNAVLADESPYVMERLVDELLASPAFGEHMARHWMDLVRFADTNGMHKDFYRNFIAYRDWIIRSFNDNLSYDEFVRAQLAGDLIPNASEDQLVASGFNRLHLIIDKGTALPEESFAKNVFDRVAAVGTTFLGLTLNCAQCHDHKYDPISQRDYYAMFAFFNNIDATPETVRGPKNGLQQPFVGLVDGSQAMVMRERGEVRPTHILMRGEYDKPGDPVVRGTPAFLPPMDTRSDVASRLDLADWMVSPEHPLTARVQVNRLWQQLFGVGLVKTSEDLGAQGEVPSHPEVLDYLAVRFVESDWDIKSVLREIVLSRTYRQGRGEPGAFVDDPENRRLNRGSRFRLDAEVIRDQILATSGRLSRSMYGRSVKPPQPDGLWKSVTMIGERYKADQGDDIVRRSVYTYWKRGMPPPQMTILNAPIRDACTARRERTNTPTQALLLLNESEYMRSARTLANRAFEMDGGDRLNHVYETITGRLPDAEEREVLEALLRSLEKTYGDEPALATELLAGVAPGEASASLAAWTMLASTIYNLDITKTRD